MPTPGYTTCDDLGDDGDDTPHSAIPEYTQPAHVQVTAAFPQDGEPDKVDLIFSDFLGSRIVTALNSANPARIIRHMTLVFIFQRTSRQIPSFPPT